MNPQSAFGGQRGREFVVHSDEGQEPALEAVVKELTTTAQKRRVTGVKLQGHMIRSLTVVGMVDTISIEVKIIIPYPTIRN